MFISIISFSLKSFIYLEWICVYCVKDVEDVVFKWLTICVSCSVVPNSLWPMDCSPPGSSVHGILQVRILEWIAIPLSRGSSWPRDWTPVSYIAGGFFTILSHKGSSGWTHVPPRFVGNHFPIELSKHLYWKFVNCINVTLFLDSIQFHWSVFLL